MSGGADLAAALVRIYAHALAEAGDSLTASVMLAQAVKLEHRPPSAAHVAALILTGYVTSAGTLTSAGRAALAQVLDSVQMPGGNLKT